MRRMLDEQEVINLIDEYGGADYTAGTGINIADNAISVNTEVIATKEDVADVQPGLSTYGVEIDDLTGKTIDDLLNAGVPSLAYREDHHDEVRNKIVWQNGDEFYLKGVFIVWSDHGGTYNPVVFTTKGGSGYYKIKVAAINSRYFILQNTKAKLSAVQTADTTPCNIYEVSQASGIQDLILASRYQEADKDYFYGVVPKISNAFADNTNFGTQLKAPTTDGDYQLEISVASGAPTYAWNAKPTIPDAVSGTNDGTNWTSLTIGEDTYGIPAGGSGSKYLHKIKIYANFSSTTYIWTEDIITSSATAYTSVSDYLTDRGYTITASSDQPTKSFSTYHGSNITAIAYRSGQGYYTSDINVSSSGTITYNTWTIQSGTPSITDEVISL